MVVFGQKKTDPILGLVKSVFVVDFWSASVPVGPFLSALAAAKRPALRMVAVYFVAIIFTASLAYRPSAVQTWL